jgi:hypothetical protein
MKTGTNTALTPLNLGLVRVRCTPPLPGLKYIQRDKATGLERISAFSSFSVLMVFPKHPEPSKPSLGDLATMINTWNNAQGDWEYSLCQSASPALVH